MGRNNRPRIRDATVSIRMPSELVEDLRRLATAEQRTVSNYIVHVMTLHVGKYSVPVPEVDTQRV
jgi:predicted DNA-binding protein